MRWSYYFKNWITTLLLGTLFLMVVIGFNSSIFTFSIDLYLFSLLFSAGFSIPTYTILAIVFNYFDDLEIDIKTVKVILISITVLGVIFTQLVAFKELNFEVSISYSLSALISGILFKLKRNQPMN